MKFKVGDRVKGTDNNKNFKGTIIHMDANYFLSVLRDDKKRGGGFKGTWFITKIGGKYAYNLTLDIIKSWRDIL